MARISRFGKIGPCFPATFFAFDANRVFENARLNRGNSYDFFFKKLLLFTFFELLQWQEFPDVEKLALGFPRTFLRFDANRVFGF
jgi:hypothetical protein